MVANKNHRSQNRPGLSQIKATPCKVAARRFESQIWENANAFGNNKNRFGSVPTIWYPDVSRVPWAPNKPSGATFALLTIHLSPKSGTNGAVVKNQLDKAGEARDLGSIPGSGKSPEGGNGNLLQYSCLENSMDRGAWQATVHGVAKSWTQLSVHVLNTTPTGRVKVLGLCT